MLIFLNYERTARVRQVWGRVKRSGEVVFDNLGMSLVVVAYSRINTTLPVHSALRNEQTDVDTTLIRRNLHRLRR